MEIELHGSEDWFATRTISYHILPPKYVSFGERIFKRALFRLKKYYEIEIHKIHLYDVTQQY